MSPACHTHLKELLLCVVGEFAEVLVLRRVVGSLGHAGEEGRRRGRLGHDGIGIGIRWWWWRRVCVMISCFSVQGSQFTYDRTQLIQVIVHLRIYTMCTYQCIVV